MGSVQSIPITTFYLIIEKNLIGDLLKIDVFLDNYPGCCASSYWWLFWYYPVCSYYGCSSYNRASDQAFQLFKSSVKIDINNQLIQDQSWNNTINLTTTQQCINSSSGKSYVYLPVKVYSTNITSKSFLVNLNVRIRSAITSDVWNASTSGEISITNGEICICMVFRSQDHFIVNVNFIGCDDVRLSYNYRTGDCVETCPCGTYSLYGSCQPISSRFIKINYCNNLVTIYNTWIACVFAFCSLYTLIFQLHA